MDAKLWRQSVRLSFIEGALSTAMGTLLSGVFLTGFALSLGANQIHIGVLAALPPLASIAQLIGAHFLNRGIDRKQFCIWSLAASRMIWTAVLAIPFVAKMCPQWSLVVLMVVVAISSLLGSVAGVASLAWIRDLVPGAKRFGFLGTRNQINTVLALVLSVAGAAFLDWCNLRFTNVQVGFTAVLFAAIVCGLAAVPVLNRLHHPDESARSRSLRQTNVSSTPLRDKDFRLLVSFYVFWNLANYLATPFFAVYMLQNLALPYWQITTLQAFASIIGLLATQGWTRLGARIGTKHVVALAVLGDAFYPLAWLFVTRETMWTLPIVFLFGVFNTPLAIGGQALAMQLASDERPSSYLAAFNAMMGIVMAVAAITGGCLAQTMTHISADSPMAEWTGLRIIFAMSFAGRLASLVLLRKVSIEEPRLAIEPLDTEMSYGAAQSALAPEVVG
jgi:MFS family permease